MFDFADEINRKTEHTEMRQRFASDLFRLIHRIDGNKANHVFRERAYRKRVENRLTSAFSSRARDGR